MENKYSIYDLMYNSYLTLFGFKSSDEDTVYKFFDTICYRNPDRAVRLYTNGSAISQKTLNNESYIISTVEEIYEIIPTLENKIIIIDNIGELNSIRVDLNNSVVRSRMFKKIAQNLREYCNNHDCTFVIGNFTYDLLSSVTSNVIQSFVGGNSMVYGSDNVFMVKEGLLNCEKSRYAETNEYKDINIKGVYLREENLKSLLGD